LTCILNTVYKYGQRLESISLYFLTLSLRFP
jgi:hypothetical protein